jgi:hypothetical protein
MPNLCPILLSPATARAGLMVFLAAASFTAGALWAGTDETPAPLAMAALPVVPTAEQAQAMNPRVPPLNDNFADAPPTF